MYGQPEKYSKVTQRLMLAMCMQSMLGAAGRDALELFCLGSCDVLFCLIISHQSRRQPVAQPGCFCQRYKQCELNQNKCRE